MLATCSNLPLSLYSASAENYSSVEWTTSGDGTFDNIALLNPAYTPGLNDASLGTVTLTLSAMGNGPCPAVTSEMIVTVLPVATAFAGEDHQINSDETFTITGAKPQIIHHYHGQLQVMEPLMMLQSVNPVYTPGTNDISCRRSNSDIDCSQ